MATTSCAFGYTLSAKANDKPQLYLLFDASLKSPNYTQIFMENGGQLDSMAAPWSTDLSITGSSNSHVINLNDTITKNVALPIQCDNYEFGVSGNVILSSNTRIKIGTQRLVTSINGTLATSLSGEGSEFLYRVLVGGSHHQIGLVYKTYKAFSATFGMSNTRLVTIDPSNGKEMRYTPEFKKMSEQQKKILEAAEAITEQYAKAGYSVRRSVSYKPSPMLSKTVFSDIVGINGSGYAPLHAIMDREMFTSLETLNALYEAAIACDCGQEKADIQHFLSVTDRPGTQAAMEARTVANATSLIVNVLMSYRKDGVNVVTTSGAGFVAVESWPWQVPRSCIDTDDCDGLSLLAVSMLRTASKLTPEQLLDPRYSYLKAVRNVLFPHYQVALGVIGATASEANSADDSHGQVAGHAITVLVPTMSFLRALSKTMDKKVGTDGPLLNSPELADTIKQTRFAALYTAKAVSELPANEKVSLSNWRLANNELTHLDTFAVEGTTPAVGTMYMPDPERRSKANRNAARDKAVFSMSAPNVFRSVKVLHVGTQFYAEVLELTFGPDHPLVADGNLLNINAAGPQYVLTPDIKEGQITRAGVTPRDMVLEEYGAFPLVHLNTAAAQVLNTAIKIAKMDIMPPRPNEALQLTEFQTTTLDESMTHVDELEEMLKERTADAEIKDHHHGVAYICAFNTLVHNPIGVKQFVDSMKHVAVSGVVDKRIIPGLAINSRGEQVGLFLHLDIYAPV